MAVLKDAQYKDYSYLSRYESFPYYFHTTDRKYIYGTTSHLNSDITYSLYTVQPGDTWDSISLAMYNNPTFFWILCDFNKVQDPYISPEVGSSVMVPVINNLSFEDDI